MKKLVYLFLAFSLLLTSCSAEVEEKEPVTRMVITETIGNSAPSEVLNVSGNITPTETIKLSFKLSGVIDSVLPSEGDKVKKGEKIAVLKPDDYVIQQKAAVADSAMAGAGISAAQAQYLAVLSEYEAAQVKVDTEIPSKTEQAKAQLDLTQSMYDRIESLYAAEAASKSQLDEITAKLKADKETYQQALDAKVVAEAELDAAKKKVDAYEAQIGIQSAQAEKANAAVQKAQNDISDTVLTSPIDGVVLTKVMNSGETTSAGYPVLAIGRTDKVYVEIGVADKYINRISKGKEAQISIYGIDEGKERTGVVEEIGMLADSATRTFTVKIVVDNSDETLRPGMIVGVKLPLEGGEAILAPIDSVLQLASGSYVFIYDDTTSIVTRREVTTGEVIGDKIQILSGVNTGESLVIDGQYVITDGETVNVKGAAQND